MFLRACLAFAVLMIVLAGAAQAGTCKPDGTPAASVQSGKPSISYDQALSRDGILAFARRNDRSAGRGYDGLLGITDTDLKRSARYALAIVGIRPAGTASLSIRST